MYWDIMNTCYLISFTVNVLINQALKLGPEKILLMTDQKLLTYCTHTDIIICTCTDILVQLQLYAHTLEQVLQYYVYMYCYTINKTSDIANTSYAIGTYDKYSIFSLL